MPAFPPRDLGVPPRPVVTALSPAAAMTIRVDRAHEDEVVVILAGEADLASAPLLDCALRALADRPGRRVVLDVADLGFLDCAAIAAVARFRRRRPDCSVTFRNPTAPVRRVLGLVGWDRLIERPDAAGGCAGIRFVHAGLPGRRERVAW